MVLPFPHVQSEPVLVVVMELRERWAGAAARIVVKEEERICRAARRSGVGDGRILKVGSSSTLEVTDRNLFGVIVVHYRDFNAEVGMRPGASIPLPAGTWDLELR